MTIDIEKLRQLEAKATKGPWGNAFMGKPDGSGRLTVDEARAYISTYPKDRDDFSFVFCTKPDGDADVCHTGHGPTSPENAAFIAETRNALPELLAEIERLRALTVRLDGTNTTLYAALGDANAKIKEMDAELSRLRRVEAAARDVTSFVDDKGPFGSLAEKDIKMREPIAALTAALEGK